MKKIKQYSLGIMIVLAMISVTACTSSNNNQTTSPTTTTTTMQTTTAGTTNSTTKSSNTTTGVIDGMIDDVEQGVEDMLGTDQTTSGTDSTKQ